MEVSKAKLLWPWLCLVWQVGLWEKRHTYSRALSGGMKRKLCIANALVASPNFILLDEVRERGVKAHALIA